MKLSDLIIENTNEDKTQDVIASLAGETFEDPSDLFKLAEIIKGLAGGDDRAKAIAMKIAKSVQSIAKAELGMGESVLEEKSADLVLLDAVKKYADRHKLRFIDIGNHGTETTLVDKDGDRIAFISINGANGYIEIALTRDGFMNHREMIKDVIKLSRKPAKVTFKDQRSDYGGGILELK